MTRQRSHFCIVRVKSGRISVRYIFYVAEMYAVRQHLHNQKAGGFIYIIYLICILKNYLNGSNIASVLIYVACYNNNGVTSL